MTAEEIIEAFRNGKHGGFPLFFSHLLREGVPGFPAKSLIWQGGRGRGFLRKKRFLRESPSPYPLPSRERGKIKFPAFFSPSPGGRELEGGGSFSAKRFFEGIHPHPNPLPSRERGKIKSPAFFSPSPCGRDKGRGEVFQQRDF